MSCERCRELLSDRLDDALTSDDERALSLHLEGCEACRRAASELEQVERLLQGGAPPEPEEAFWGGYRERLAARLDAARRRRAARRRLGWAASGLAAAAVLILAVLLSGPADEEGGAPTPDRAWLADVETFRLLDRTQGRLAERGDAETLGLVEDASLMVEEAASLAGRDEEALRSIRTLVREAGLAERVAERARAVGGADPALDEDLAGVGRLLQRLSTPGGAG